MFITFECAFFTVLSVHADYFRPQNDTDLSTVDEGGVAAVRDGETYPCGGCGREVKDDDEAIFCESGCEQWYHRWGLLNIHTTYVQHINFNMHVYTYMYMYISLVDQTTPSAALDVACWWFNTSSAAEGVVWSTRLTCMYLVSPWAISNLWVVSSLGLSAPPILFVPRTFFYHWS